MSAHDFEREVAALYRDVQPSKDDAAFIAHLDRCISHQQRTRRWVLATLGTLGVVATVMLLGRSGVGAILERWLGSAESVLAAMASIPWGATAMIFVLLLILPVFIRSIVDPK